MFKSSFALSISVCFLGYGPFPSLLLLPPYPSWSSSNKVISILPCVSPVSSCTDHTSWKSLPSMLRYNFLALNHCRKCRKAIVVVFFCDICIAISVVLLLFIICIDEYCWGIFFCRYYISFLYECFYRVFFFGKFVWCYPTRKKKILIYMLIYFVDLFIFAMHSLRSERGKLISRSTIYE